MEADGKYLRVMRVYLSGTGIWRASFLYQLFGFLWIFILGIQFFPIINYLLEHASNMNHLLNGVCFLMVNLVGSFKNGTFLVYRKKVQFAIAAARAENQKFVNEAEKITTLLSNTFALLVMPSAVTFAFTTIIASVMSNADDNKQFEQNWILPFTMSFPMNFDKITCTDIIADSLYMGLCFHIFGLLEDVKENVRKLDGRLEGFGRFRYRDKEDNGPQRRVDLYKSVYHILQYHIEIYNYIPVMGEIFSSMIFFMFFTSTLLLVALVIKIETGGTNGYERLPVHPMLALCILCSLFLFICCYFGTGITSEAGEVRELSYLTNWYEHEPSNRTYMLMIMMRAQKDVYFRGFNFFYCNLESYKSVLNMTCSMVAVLHNMK